MSEDFYLGYNCLVTGGNGFLARHLIDALLAVGANCRAVARGPRPTDLDSRVGYMQADLRNRDAAFEVMEGVHYAFHLAAVGWGMHANLERQPELLTENVLLNTTVLDAAHRAGVQRYLFASSTAVYSGFGEKLHEDDPWDQPPHPSEAAFGWAKRLGEIQCRTYHEHYGMPIAIVRPANPYGPWDSYDVDRCHVIPALIARAVAGENPLKLRGTGRAARSWIWAPDVARGMMLALERQADCQPVNLASDRTETVENVARLILDLAGSDAKIEYDGSTDGHLLKVPDVRRAAAMGLSTFLPLREGLRRTIEWYRANQT